MTSTEAAMVFALHAVVISFAVAMLALAIRINRIDRSRRVLLLVESEVTMKPLLACLACFAALIPLLWAVFSAQVIPRGEPAHFVTFVVALAIGFVAMLIVVADAVMRRTSLGSITLLDDKTLRVQLVDHVNEFTVTSVRIAKTSGSPLAPYARYDLSDGNTTLLFFGALPNETWATIEGELQPLNGTLIAGSSMKLFEWAQPHLTRR